MQWKWVWASPGELISLFTSLVDSLAWPLVVLVLAFFYRDAILKLLDRLTRLKTPIGEANFVAEELAKANRALRGEPAEERASSEAESGISTDDELRSEIQRIADVSPRAAMLEAWLPFEVRVAQIYPLAMAPEQVPEKVRLPPWPTLTQRLVRKGVLETSEGQAIDHIREIRNRVVHSRDVSITAEQVVEIADLLERIWLKMERRLPKVTH